MARIKNNPLLKGVSGKIGDNIIIKEYKDGRRVMQNKPKKRKTNSRKQRDHFENFRLGVEYADEQLKQPAVRELYERRAKGTNRTAQNLIVRDFLLAPIIHAIELPNYTGAPGEVIRIRASDDFKIVSLSVTIETENGKILEKGEAQLRGKKGLWRYFTTVINANLAGTVISVVAIDLPHNEARASLTCGNVPGEQKWVLDPKDPNGFKKMKALRDGK
ncbi:hypothetical protein WBG78_16375 [Chryseolinea sp. T2]|uniref:hypothetical protein n=1 Tax=Chryseolinea sp. T2 TaxID=3129255 RepID=UPI003077C42D